MGSAPSTVKSTGATAELGLGVRRAAGPHRGGRKPLADKVILVGRARHQAAALADRFREKGAQVVEIPFIQIHKPRSFKPLDEALETLHRFDWLILTSVNGVEALSARLQKLAISKQKFQHLKIVAIGPATRSALEKKGLKVDLVPKQYVAESVVRSLKARVRGQRVLLIRAKLARDVIPRRLRAAGAQVKVVEAYETVVPQASAARLRAALGDATRKIDVITFTSSSTVRNFLMLLGLGKDHKFAHPSMVVSGIKLASIGPVTSATLRESGLRVDIEAKPYTIPGLVRAIVDEYQKDPSAASSLRQRHDA